MAKHWVLVTVGRKGHVLVSEAYKPDRTPGEMVRALLGHPYSTTFNGMPPLMKAVAVARAEHDPGSFILKPTQDGFGAISHYKFEWREP